MVTAFSFAPAPWRRALLATMLALLSAVAMGCAAPAGVPAGWPERLAKLLPADVLLLGEQHDAPEHHAMERSAVQWLAARGQLAALVIEMAPAGGSTEGLAAHSDAVQVRSALQWDERLWPWENYAGMVMAAVRAGAPVRGGNLPRADMRAAMANPVLDRSLPGPGYAAQLDAVREAHCGLLPSDRLPGMVRIQIARDQRMAQVAADAARRAPGRTVLLVAGGGHVLRSRGIPVHLPRNFESKVALAHSGKAQAAINFEADLVQTTPALPPSDPCAPLRARPLATPAARQ